MRSVALIVSILLLPACADQTEQPPALPELPRFALASSDPIEHGKRLSHVLGCVGCHTPELTGEDWTEPEMGVLWTANLTRSAARYSHDQLAKMITQGKRPDRALWDMPSYLFTRVHSADIDALIAYLQTLKPRGEVHPDPTMGPELERMIGSGEWVDSALEVEKKRNQGPPDLGEKHAFGRHILRATCAECHGMDLLGSDAPFPGAPPRPDLRIVGSYTREDFARFMETGKAAGDRELALMSAVARRRYSHFTDAEEDAVYAYLAEYARHSP